jgi:hypothetical protein
MKLLLSFFLLLGLPIMVQASKEGELKALFDELHKHEEELSCKPECQRDCKQKQIWLHGMFAQLIRTAYELYQESEAKVQDCEGKPEIQAVVQSRRRMCHARTIYRIITSVRTIAGGYASEVFNTFAAVAGFGSLTGQSEAIDELLVEQILIRQLFEGSEVDYEAWQEEVRISISQLLKGRLLIAFRNDDDKQEWVDFFNQKLKATLEAKNLLIAWIRAIDDKLYTLLYFGIHHQFWIPESALEGVRYGNAAVETFALQDEDWAAEGNERDIPRSELDRWNAVAILVGLGIDLQTSLGRHPGWMLDHLCRAHYPLLDVPNRIDDENFLRTIELFLILGIDVNAQDRPQDGDLLGLAINNQHSKVVELLLNYGAETEQIKGIVHGVFNSALHLAALRMRVELVQLLLERGLSPLVIDSWGTTPRERIGEVWSQHYVGTAEYKEIVRLLEEAETKAKEKKLEELWRLADRGKLQICFGPIPTPQAAIGADNPESEETPKLEEDILDGAIPGGITLNQPLPTQIEGQEGANPLLAQFLAGTGWGSF